MAARKYGRAHQRARAAALSSMFPGQPCARCGHPIEPGDKVDLDHRDDGNGYLGLSHSSPCPTCGQRCNQRAGGQRAAILAGRKLRERRCLICGKPFEATSGSAGANQATCGDNVCRAKLRALRKARQPDPEPPPVQGRAW